MPEAEAPENLLDQLALTGALPRSAVASARQTARPGATPLGPVHSLIARGELEPAQVAAILITSCAPVLCNACGTQTTTDAPRCTSCDAEFDGPPILTSADVMLAERAGELRLGRAVAGQPGLARYQARAELGRGGMGVVLRALDTRLNREVALKVIRADRGNLASRVQRFLQEGRMLAALDHKGIVRVFEAGRHQRRVFMAMELVKGESLRDLARSGRLKLGAAVDAIVAAADALEAVHRHGIVHRDVKPANIVIEAETGRARLIDFGLARDEASSGNLTMAGVVVGTPHYFAPEQVQLREADGRTDIWALGVCLYELLFGRRPFLGRSKIEIVGKILKHTPAARRRDGHPLPEPLVEVALHALAKDPGDRPQTAATFADELRQARAAWQAGQSGDLIRASTASGRWSGSGSESASGTAPRQGRPREGGHAPRRLASADATASVRSLRARSRPAVKRRGPHPGLVIAGLLAVAVVALLAALVAQRARPPENSTVATRAPEAGTTEAASRELEPPRTSPAPPPPIPVVTPDDPFPLPREAPAEDRLDPEPVPAGIEVPGPEPGASETPASSETPEAEPAPVVDESVAVAEPEAVEPEATPTESAPHVGRVPALEHKAWLVRALASAAIARAHPAGAPHVTAAPIPGLVRLLGDTEPLVRSLAVDALASYDPALLARYGGAPLEGMLRKLAEEGAAGLATRCDNLLLTLARHEPGEAPGAMVEPALAPVSSPDIEAAIEAGEALASVTRTGLDVVCVLDVTTSMVDELALAKTDLPKLLAGLHALIGKRARVGVVTYGNRVLNTITLTDKSKRLTLAVGSLEREVDASNKTIEEALDQAMAHVLTRKLAWKRRSRVSIVIADAPCPAGKEVELLALCENAHTKLGVRVSALIADPPANYKVQADPAPQLRALAFRGGGRTMPLAGGEAPLRKLLLLALGQPEEVVAPLVDAWLAAQ